MDIQNVVSLLPRHRKETYKTRPQSAITHLVIHHSATATGSPSAFARYHVDTHGWPGIAYHYVIALNGTVFKTQNLTTISYHASNANPYSVGICLVGSYDKEAPPQPQIEALISLIEELRAVLHIPANRVIGHREVPAPKSCPGTAFDMNALRIRLGGANE